MPLGPGTRLGPYEIVAAIGAGGMGEVYRATDTNLGRDVAIKVLPEAFAQDPERIARFEREAKTLASLNHPNIAGIYGLEKSQGTYALVMELVEGEDLSQRTARGPIPLDEALPVAKQIAEALEAAHEQGIIHRDLKPANIKIKNDGSVKVLDFGLAKLAEASAAAGTNPSPLSLSPTITSPALMTGVGVLLGTAAYMSPEQAKGRAADKRSDIWSFGCVLYEMLTGKRPFDGEDVTDVLVALLGKESADLHALRADVPVAIRTLLRRCLEKDRRKRIGDIAAALVLIDEVGALSGAAHGSPPAIVQRSRSLWRRLATYSLPALIAGAAIVGGAEWLAMRPAPPRVSRFAITTTPATAPYVNGVDRDVAITPDGSQVIYAGANGAQLFVRALDALEPSSVFRGAPRAPFISPDGQWIGFADAIYTLKKVAITGGPVVTITQADGGSRGATWLADDTIIFGNADPSIGLQRVSSAGGVPVVLTRPDRAKGEIDHLWPEALPGNRGVLFTITTSGNLETAEIAVLDLQTGTRKIVVRGGTHAHYVGSGHLIYAASGTLRAVAFDLDKLETRGTSIPVIPVVPTTAFGGLEAAISAEGTLAYMTGGGSGFYGAARTLVWVDRQGQETPIDAPPRVYLYPRLSPDGTRIAVQSADQELDIWLWDLIRRTLTRLTFAPANDSNPAWTPDGRRVIFSSEQSGPRNIYSMAADGTGVVERLTDSPNLQQVVGVSPDGTRLIFVENMPKTGLDLMQLRLGASPSGSPDHAGSTESNRVVPLVQTPFTEQNGFVSPDGRWLAYEATDSGQSEIYVRPFPDVSSGRWQISTGGGTRPLWAPNGQELFYLSPVGAVMRVGVERGPSWTSTTPSILLKENDSYYRVPPGLPLRTYDISPDGRRFLMIKVVGANADAGSPSIVVVQHWDQELKRLVPTK
jgi:eukaryotic-like serine/threonine-protein kinase